MSDNKQLDVMINHIELAEQGIDLIAKHTDCKRTYIVYTQAWYAESAQKYFRHDPSAIEEITLSFGYGDSSTVGSFILYIHRFSTDRNNEVAVRLSVFTDGMLALASMPDLMLALIELEKTPAHSVKEVTDLLDRLGFEDVTTRKSPYDKE